MTRLTSMLVGLVTVLAFTTTAHATLNTCSAAKQLCVAKKTAALLKCHSKNSKPPVGLDPAKFATCIQKAKTKFDGGTNPAKGCFAKLEAKYGIGCLTSGDTAALEAQVDDYVDAILCSLDPAAGTCPVPTPTPTATPAPSCVNGMQDGSETGVDCGGPNCPDCTLGGGCLVANDCVSTTVCSGGFCVCGAGQSDCNGSPGDACETNITTNTSNCGGCNLLCNPANASPTCNAGQCQIDSCVPGFADCDAQTANGCETNTDTSNFHCGFCGNVCSMPLTCMNGLCL